MAEWRLEWRNGGWNVGRVLLTAGRTVLLISVLRNASHESSFLPILNPNSSHPIHLRLVLHDRASTTPVRQTGDRSSPLHLTARGRRPQTSFHPRPSFMSSFLH